MGALAVAGGILLAIAILIVIGIIIIGIMANAPNVPDKVTIPFEAEMEFKPTS